LIYYYYPKEETAAEKFDGTKYEMITFNTFHDTKKDKFGKNVYRYKRFRDTYFKFFENIPRLTFIGLMAKACLMAGNSSSGIIEAATFGLPVINVGSRQNYRERNTNVVDIFYDLSLFRTSIKQIINHKENIKYLNRYGNGTAGSKIYSCLKSIDISNRALEKINAY
jgi:UDP-N-acetylglucosamine 2-epimerase